MESWIICGIVASLAWGIYIFLLKIAISEKQYNIPPSAAFGAMSLGILGVALITFLAMSSNISSFSLTGAGIALASGLVWGVGMACVIQALSKLYTPIAKLTPLYNTNTLVATILGILLLKEVPYHISTVILGAILVVLGGVLVTRQTSINGSSQPGLGNDMPTLNLERWNPRLENWITYGIIASLAWGVYALLLKLAVSPEYYGGDPFVAFLAMSVGILIVSLSVFIRGKGSVLHFSKARLMVAFTSGVIWAIGMLAVIFALFNLQADVARLVPVYNTNTLIATLLGIILLHEVPKQRLIIIIGAILIVIGGSIVAIF